MKTHHAMAMAAVVFVQYGPITDKNRVGATDITYYEVAGPNRLPGNLLPNLSLLTPGMPSIDQAGLVHLMLAYYRPGATASLVSVVSLVSMDRETGTVTGTWSPAPGNFASKATLTPPPRMLVDGSALYANGFLASTCVRIAADGTMSSWLPSATELPESPGKRFQLSPSMSVLANGTSITFSGSLATIASPSTNAGEGLWRNDGEGAKLIAATGMIAPGTAGARFAANESGGTRIPLSMAMNSAGTLAFTARHDTSQAGPGTFMYGLWLSEPGQPLRVLASNFNYTAPISMNSRGDVAYAGGSGSTGAVMVWDHGMNQSRVVHQPTTTQPAPGLYVQGAIPLILNDNGQVLIRTGVMMLGNPRVSGGLALVDGQTTRTIWVDGLNTLLGTPYQVALNYPMSLPEFVRPSGALGYERDVVFNNTGQAVFSLMAWDQGIFIRNNFALMGWDPIGGLCTLAMVGQPVPLPGYDGQTIFSIDWVGGSNGMDGRAMSFNDRGELAFRILTSDGQYVAMVATIPGPGSFAALWLGVVAFARHRRRLVA